MCGQGSVAGTGSHRGREKDENGWSIRVRGSFGLGNGTFRLGWEKGCQETASVVYKWVSVRSSAKSLGD